MSDNLTLVDERNMSEAKGELSSLTSKLGENKEENQILIETSRKSKSELFREKYFPENIFEATTEEDNEIEVEIDIGNAVDIPITPIEDITTPAIEVATALPLPGEITSSRLNDIESRLDNVEDDDIPFTVPVEEVIPSSGVTTLKHSLSGTTCTISAGRIRLGDTTIIFSEDSVTLTGSVEEVYISVDINNDSATLLHASSVSDNNADTFYIPLVQFLAVGADYIMTDIRHEGDYNAFATI